MAYHIAQTTLRPYPHRCSPKRYTQPQLFVALVLRVFLKTDYRGVTTLLGEWAELRAAFQLRRVPHFTTLQKASARLLQRARFRRLFAGTVRRVLGRRRQIRRAAFDSTGLDCGHTSHYFVRRRAKGATAAQKVRSSRFAKLEAAFDGSQHLILGAIPRRGPHVDTDRFVPLLDETLRYVHAATVLADAGYDAEPNHRYARQQRGVRSVIPATAGRPTPKPPTGHYRRLMKRRMHKGYCQYGQRWQAECGFSMLKRRLGSALGARTYGSQCREFLLFVLTFNLMLA